MSKKRKAKARRAGAAETPKAPRTDAQLAAARANIERAREARQERQAHPADSPDKPAAFFAFGKGKSKADEGDGKAPKGAAAKAADAVKRVLSAAEADSFQGTIFEVLVKLWGMLDQGLTATAFDHEECIIWRSIDDDDTRFLARRIIAVGRKNAVVGEQIRMLVDRWDDYRVVTILGPRVLQSVGWYPAHGLDLAQWGGPAVPPGSSRRSRPSATGRGQSGPHSSEYSANGHAASPEAYVYGN